MSALSGDWWLVLFFVAIVAGFLLYLYKEERREEERQRVIAAGRRAARFYGDDVDDEWDLDLEYDPGWNEYEDAGWDDRELEDAEEAHRI